MKLHRVNVSDPMFWEGPDGPNRIVAEGLGLVSGSPRFQIPKAFYLLRVLRPFEADGEEVSHLLLHPRHAGDRIESAARGYCVVGICRVKPGVRLDAGDEVGGFDFEYWAIGSVEPLDS